MKKVTDSRRLAELLGEVVTDFQARLQLEEATAMAAVSPNGQRRAAKQPAPFVDLRQFAGLSDREVVKAIAPEIDRHEMGRMLLAVKAERCGRHDNKHRTAGRCEAGSATLYLLRCSRTAMPEQPWCRMHHPAPPAAPTFEQQKSARVDRMNLWMRGDGRVLEAVYALADRVEELQSTAWTLIHRLEASDRERVRLEQELQAGRTGEEWMTAAQLGERLGMSTGWITTETNAGRFPHHKVGSRIRFTSKDAAKIDELLAREPRPRRRSQPVR